MIKHSKVELYVQYETLKGFKVKVLFNNLDARYVSKYRADIQKGKQWQDIYQKKKKNSSKSCLLSHLQLVQRHFV